MAPPPLATREAVREERFSDVWNNDLNDAFAGIFRGAAQLQSPAR
jgi:hypothetical protein